jgi:putative transposase
VKSLSFKGHRFPSDVIRYAVWLYFRFNLSLRDVEELLAQRGIDVSYETIRCWTIKFGPQIAARLRRLRPAPTPRWHLDEVVCSIGGKRMFIWRAVDDEGEVMDLVVQLRRDTEAALRLLKRLLRSQGRPEAIVTDGLGSYRAALEDLDLRHIHHQVGYGRTTEQKTHTCQSDDGNGRCSCSRANHPPSAFSPPTPPSTTPSTRNDI